MAKFTKKGVTYLSSTGEVLDCLFCKIQRREEPGNIVYEDDNFVVFKTIKPATHLHLLVTPRQHVKNVDALKGRKGIELVNKLVEAGKAALGAHAHDAQFSFHVPPLNSIDHLHLHAIASPSSMSFFGRRKYQQDTFYCQSPEMVIARLLKQKDEGDGDDEGEEKGETKKRTHINDDSDLGHKNCKCGSTNNSKI